jgi:hypothetical protein
MIIRALLFSEAHREIYHSLKEWKSKKLVISNADLACMPYFVVIKD